jgi:hypothetical protein
VHPIERLRYVARASGADQAILVRETAGALAAFTDDPAGLVTACRRIVARHPGSGPLWWLCSRVLIATEPMREAWQATDELEEDRTAQALSQAIPDDATVCVLGWPDLVADALRRRGDLDVLVVDALSEGSGLVRVLERADVAVTDVPVTGTAAAAAEADLVLLEAAAVGPDAALAISSSRAAAAVARTSGTPVWLTAGVGRLVPGRIWDCMVQRLDAACDPWDADEELVPLDLVDKVVGPDGPEDPADARRRTDCPIAPELFKEL